MFDYIMCRVIDEAKYIVEHKATVRETGDMFGVSKSTVHSDMMRRLKYIDSDLYESVREVLEYNFSVRHLRGGESTKQLYMEKNGGEQFGENE